MNKTLHGKLIKTLKGQMVSGGHFNSNEKALIFNRGGGISGTPIREETVAKLLGINTGVPHPTMPL